MIIDGYDTSMSAYIKARAQFEFEMREMVQEIESMPVLPNSMEEWIVSWVDPNNKKFDLSAARKHTRMKKKYIKLIDSSANDMQRLKLASIEELLSKINLVLNDSK